MRKDRNSPEFTRRAIRRFLGERGFAEMELEKSGQVLLQPNVHQVYAKGDKRITICCYGKFGLVCLFVRGGVKIGWKSDVAEQLGKVFQPPESPELQYWPGPDFDTSLPQDFSEADEMIRAILSFLIDAVGEHDTMVETLLAAPEEYSKLAALKGLHVHALRFECADRYLEGADRKQIMHESVDWLKSHKTPAGTPFAVLKSLIEARWSQGRDA